MFPHNIDCYIWLANRVEVLVNREEVGGVPEDVLGEAMKREL